MLQARLKVVGGKHDGQVIPLKARKFLIGRESDCHLRTNSDLISRHHCVFTLDPYAVRLRDLGSTNGTFVNGERVQGQVVLNAGDRVRIGRLEFELEIPVAAVLEAEKSTGAAPETLPPVEKGDDASDTAYELPVEPAPSETDTAVGYHEEDTAVIPVPPPQQQHDPYQQPGYYPPYYPQYPQGYYPQPPGYYPQYGAPYPPPPGGYPQAPGYYPPQGYPQQQPEHQQPEPPSGDARNRGGNVPSPPVRLPSPEETGAAGAPPSPGNGTPAKPADGDAEKEKTPSERAAEILRQRMQRRLQGS